MVLLYQIFELMMQDRIKPKLCVIHKIEGLLKGHHDGAANFIEALFRVARKYNGWFITTANFIDAYGINKATARMYEWAMTKILFRHPSRSLNKLDEIVNLYLPSHAKSLLKGLKHDTECLIHSKGDFYKHQFTEQA